MSLEAQLDTALDTDIPVEFLLVITYDIIKVLRTGGLVVAGKYPAEGILGRKAIAFRVSGRSPRHIGGLGIVEQKLRKAVEDVGARSVYSRPRGKINCHS